VGQQEHPQGSRDFLRVVWGICGAVGMFSREWGHSWCSRDVFGAAGMFWGAAGTFLGMSVC
jgi:hypothetical protein